MKAIRILCCVPLACLAMAASPAPQHDGQHDFDFEIGTWKTHLRRRLNPLTGSNS